MLSRLCGTITIVQCTYETGDETLHAHGSRGARSLLIARGYTKLLTENDDPDEYIHWIGGCSLGTFNLSTRTALSAKNSDQRVPHHPFATNTPALPRFINTRQQPIRVKTTLHFEHPYFRPAFFLATLFQTNPAAAFGTTLSSTPVEITKLVFYSLVVALVSLLLLAGAWIASHMKRREGQHTGAGVSDADYPLKPSPAAPLEHLSPNSPHRLQCSHPTISRRLGSSYPIASYLSSSLPTAPSLHNIPNNGVILVQFAGYTACVVAAPNTPLSTIAWEVLDSRTLGATMIPFNLATSSNSTES